MTSVTCQDECFSFGDDSLFCIDLSNYALTELPAPTGSTVDPRYRLFADGTAFVAVEDPARIYRIEPDGGYTLMAEFEPTQRPNSYAYNAETDTLYYQLESAVYAAPHFDIANACRAALSGGADGRGLLIGKNSYVIVGTFDGKGEVFDLDEKPANVTELVVSGMGAFMSDAVRAQNPSLTLVEDPVRNALFNEDEGGEYAARYCEKLLSGEAKADLVRSFYDEDAILQRAGWGKPITDKALCAEIDLMPDGMRDYVTKDGAYIGMPNDTFSILSDITISTKNWAALGLGEYPTTWMELLEKLAALSHSADAGKYGISTPYLGIEQTLAAQLANGYARSWAAQGMEMDFGGTEFKAALDMLKRIDFAALRHDAEGSWSEASQPLLSLGGSECSPIFEFSFAERRTLKVHPEDSLISEAGCYIVRINPNTHAEQQAYALLRAQTSNDQYIYNRLTYDFATPAAELAGLSGGRATAEQIERFRRNVGDVWFSGLDARTAEKRDEALADYAQGEMDFDALAAQPDAEALFYRTDHHWTADGARCSYEQLCAAWGLAPATPSGRLYAPGFYGSAYARAPQPLVSADTLTFDRFDSVVYAIDGAEMDGLWDADALGARDKYAALLYGNPARATLTSETGTGTLLVLKDSYANALLPAVATHFARTEVVDLRYFNGDLVEIAKETEVEKILCIYGMNTFLTDRSLALVAASFEN